MDDPNRRADPGRERITLLCASGVAGVNGGPPSLISNPAKKI